MILYPIIENSIFHGILPSLKKGRIHVHVVKKDQTIQIKISDNGVGMTGEKLKKVRELLNEDILEYSEHLGLKNVNTRLTLLYGNQSALNIESQCGQGTTIMFLLPL
jgi:two-component system sensor histidine kinase YesM